MPNNIDPTQPQSQPQSLVPVAGVPNRQPKGTGYINLSSFLNANNGGALGNTLGNTVMNNVNSTTGANQTAQNQFSQQYGNAQNNLNGLQNGAQTALNQIINTDPNAAYNATPFTQDQVNNWNNYQNASYQGPQGINNFNDLLNRQNQTSQFANLLGDTAGQRQLLNSLSNKGGNYTNTDQSLDALFLGSKPIQQNLQQIRSQALNQLANNDINAFNNLDQMSAQNAQNNLLQNQQNLISGAQNQVRSIQTDLNNKLASMQSTSQVAMNTSNAWAANDFSGLTPAQQAVVAAAQKYGWANPTSYEQYTGPVNQTLAGVASNQQANQLAGLQQLLASQPGIALTGQVGGAQGATANFGNIVGAAQGAMNKVLGQSGQAFEQQYSNAANNPGIETSTQALSFAPLNFLGQNHSLQDVLTNGVPSDVNQMLSQSGYNVANTDAKIQQAAQAALQMLQNQYGLTPMGQTQTPNMIRPGLNRLA